MANAIHIIQRSNLAVVTYTIADQKRLALELGVDASGPFARWWDQLAPPNLNPDVYRTSLRQAVGFAWEKVYDPPSPFLEVPLLNVMASVAPWQFQGIDNRRVNIDAALPANVPGQELEVLNVIANPAYFTLGGARFQVWRRAVVDQFTHEREIRGLVWEQDYAGQTVPGALA